MSTSGPLGLVGGAEFTAGNEEHDTRLVAAAAGGLGLCIPTAAARQRPEEAAEHCRRWFGRLGADVEILPVLNKRDAASAELAARARQARLIYLPGGDPGLIASVLRDSAVGTAIVEAWSHGAALTGSSAGAMALAAQVLVRESFPGSARRRPVPGLGVIPNSAVLPHHNTFGQRWLPSARAALPDLVLIGVDERTSALWEGGRYRCWGPGELVVYGPDDIRRFTSGESVEGIPPPVPTPTA